MPTLQPTSTPQTMVITTKANLEQLPIVDGQYVHVKDNGKQYFDWDGARIDFNDIRDITSAEKATVQSDPNCIGKLYFITDTNELATYNGTEWVVINKSQSVVFVDMSVGSDFPETGRKDAIYVNGTKMYRYDENSASYLEIGKDLVWGSF